MSDKIKSWTKRVTSHLEWRLMCAELGYTIEPTEMGEVAKSADGARYTGAFSFNSPLQHVGTIGKETLHGKKIYRGGSHV